MVSLTDCPDLTKAIYHEHKTPKQQQQGVCVNFHFLPFILWKPTLVICLLAWIKMPSHSWGLLFKERTCSWKSKLFPLKSSPLF